MNQDRLISLADEYFRTHDDCFAPDDYLQNDSLIAELYDYMDGMCA